MTVHAIPVLKQVGIPIATVEHVTEAVARMATDENAYGEMNDVVFMAKLADT